MSDVFVAKLSSDDGSLVWAVSGGGTAEDSGKGITVDLNGNVIVVGHSRSKYLDFWGTQNCIRILSSYSTCRRFRKRDFKPRISLSVRFCGAFSVWCYAIFEAELIDMAFSGLAVARSCGLSSSFGGQCR